MLVSLIHILSTDIDECQLGLDSCATNAECFDTEGSYTCTCSSGFGGDGLSNCDSELLFTALTSEVWSYIPILSSDINECTEDTHMCDTLADCIDTEGSYMCVCSSGYIGDGIICTGECKFTSHCMSSFLMLLLHHMFLLSVFIAICTCQYEVQSHVIILQTCEFTTVFSGMTIKGYLCQLVKLHVYTLSVH